ncbi:hypothetical protein OROMI_034698 [Orobanche minor]
MSRQNLIRDGAPPSDGYVTVHCVKCNNKMGFMEVAEDGSVDVFKSELVLGADLE